MLRSLFSWCLIALGAVGVAVSYWGIWVLVANFAAGLLWWSGGALLFSGPVAAVGALIAQRKPRQKAALIAGVAVASAWFLLWLLCLTVLGFTWAP